jgi:hypothetical protein
MAINKYADGLSYVLFPGNLGYGAVGYNFPNSTAQDDGGGVGAISLSFSGSIIPYLGTEYVSGWGYGPSGFFSAYTPLATLKTDTYKDFRFGFGFVIPNTTYSSVDFCRQE